jgi:hypothetical protein
MTRTHLSAIRIFATSLFLIFIGNLPAHGQDHIHQLYYNNSQWVDTDLTALTHGGTSYPGLSGEITAFFTTPNNQPHVFYIDTNEDIHQLYDNGTNWSDQNLTELTGGSQAFGTLSGFSVGNLQHVFFVGYNDSHIHQLYYNNSKWVDQDITALAGAQNDSGGELVAFATTPNDNFHVYYQGAGGFNDLHQLYFNGTSWSDSNLTTITGGYGCFGHWIAGFAMGNIQQIFCAGYSNPNDHNVTDIMNIYYNNANWLGQDITKLSGAPSNFNGSGIAAFNVPNTQEINVYSVASGVKNGLDVAQDVHQTEFFENSWSDEDLTSKIGAPTGSDTGGMVAFPITTAGIQYHVYYAPSKEVYQLYYSGSAGWQVEDLTNGAGHADNGAGMAGFAIGNLQYVYYLSTQ